MKCFVCWIPEDFWGHQERILLRFGTCLLACHQALSPFNDVRPNHLVWLVYCLSTTFVFFWGSFSSHFSSILLSQIQQLTFSVAAWMSFRVAFTFLCSSPMNTIPTSVYLCILWSQPNREVLFSLTPCVFTFLHQFFVFMIWNKNWKNYKYLQIVLMIWIYFLYKIVLTLNHTGLNNFRGSIYNYLKILEVKNQYKFFLDWF